jgi:hypothetical protein
MWQMTSVHPSDKFAIEYWSKFFTASPDCFPNACYQLVIFCKDEGRLVAELFQNRSVEAKVFAS